MPKRHTAPHTRAQSPDQLVTISCRAPRRLRIRLDQLARQDRRSQSSYLRLLLEDVLPKRTVAATGEALP